MTTTTRRMRAAAVGAVAMMALGACSSSDRIDKAGGAAATTTAATDRTTTSAGGGASDSASDTASDPGFAALEAKLLTEVPAGFEQQADDVGDTGPSDLDKAVHDDGSPDARKSLVADGFVRGYQRLWENGSEHQIIVFLYEFRTPEGASSNVARMVAGFGPPPDPSSSFTVDGIAGSVGQSGAGEQTAGAVVMYATGPYAVQVDVNGPASEGTADAIAMAKQLGTAQYQRLQG